MSSPGASTPADASTLGTRMVTPLNVGMHAADSFKSQDQGSLRARLRDIIMKWLEGPGAAAVALNEIHSNIAASGSSVGQLWVKRGSRVGQKWVSSGSTVGQTVQFS